LRCVSEKHDIDAGLSQPPRRDARITRSTARIQDFDRNGGSLVAGNAERLRRAAAAGGEDQQRGENPHALPAS